MITMSIILTILKNIYKNFTIEALMTYLQKNRFPIYQRTEFNHVICLADGCTCS